MGLEVARSVIESGGDVICLDQTDKPLQEPWGQCAAAKPDPKHHLTLVSRSCG